MARRGDLLLGGPSEASRNENRIVSLSTSVAREQQPSTVALDELPGEVESNLERGEKEKGR